MNNVDKEKAIKFIKLSSIVFLIGFAIACYEKSIAFILVFGGLGLMYSVEAPYIIYFLKGKKEKVNETEKKEAKKVVCISAVLFIICCVVNKFFKSTVINFIAWYVGGITSIIAITTIVSLCLINMTIDKANKKKVKK